MADRGTLAGSEQIIHHQLAHMRRYRVPPASRAPYIYGTPLPTLAVAWRTAERMTFIGVALDGGKPADESPDDGRYIAIPDKACCPDAAMTITYDDSSHLDASAERYTRGRQSG